MAHFLVTGGAGFVGSHLAEALLDQGHAVRVLDDLSTGRAENLPRRANLIEGDVTDPAAVERAFSGIDGCFHLAAIASVARSHCEWRRTHQVNLTGTINIFDQARSLRNRREISVVYASSSAVYGDYASVPVSEQDCPKPLSAYGVDKLACELHARIATAVHGVPTVGLRFFNLYGPRQNSRSQYSGVIAIFAERLSRGEPIEIFGDGEQVRDFTFVGDAVSGLCRAMRSATPNASVFNICTGKGTTVRALAEAMAALYRTELVIDYRAARSGEVRFSIGNPRRAAEQLGFRANMSLADGLAVMLEYSCSSKGVSARFGRD